ncbi:uncharacterized protein LOC142575981 [Dermacentor variabilis]|uniref:uncharacterized protein LOC142575981 n=1 Tax=Dermacentor variabilis TaxID=34621 RepID=UPI003F5C89E3
MPPFTGYKREQLPSSHHASQGDRWLLRRMASCKVLHLSVFALVVLQAIILCFGQPGNAPQFRDDSDLKECPVKCDKHNNYTCDQKDCICVYTAGSTGGVCYDFSDYEE